jgi:hypothetical protein
MARLDPLEPTDSSEIDTIDEQRVGILMNAATRAMLAELAAFYFPGSRRMLGAMVRKLVAEEYARVRDARGKPLPSVDIERHRYPKKEKAGGNANG